MKITPASLRAISEVRGWCQSGHAREIRVGLNLSQAEVAAAVGTHQGVVSNWERALRLPTGPKALRYHKVLTVLSGASSGGESTTTVPPSGDAA